MKTNRFSIPQTNLNSELSTIVEILDYRAEHQSEEIAYEFLQDDESDSLSYQELAIKAKAIASELLVRNLQQERVLLIYSAGLEFITAFLGCLYAGVIAVPVYPPRRNQKLSRLESIVNDCTPKAVLTTNELKTKVETYLLEKIKPQNYIITDRLQNKNNELQLNSISPDKIAFLQYTSGSTGNPKGVIITHNNIVQNSALIYKCFEHSANSKVVSWLPFYHDMGLIGGILQPLYGGLPVTLFSPTEFLRKPLLWLQTISKFKATTSGAPNFAYEMCIEKITAEDKKKLDLSSWDLAFIGAEPIRTETLDKFTEAFKECGFKKSAFYPCYGMAEATLMVSGGIKKKLPIVSQNNDNNINIVSCGKVNLGQKVVIVDSNTKKVCKEQEIGEIWIEDNGSIANGYWNREQETQEIFKAQIDSEQKDYLRTGDLGFIEDKELFVTSRIKDIIIIRGQNYYPQDIEKTVERSHPALKANSGAAFSIEIAKKEQLVIVQEVERSFVRKLNVGANNSSSLPEIEDAVRSAISEEYGLNVYDIQLIKTGSISKTSSGKIQRYLCKEKYLKNDSQIARTIISWLRDYARDNINSKLIDERRCIPPYIVLDFGNQGLLGMQVPQKYGGLGLNNYETMQILEQLGAIDTTLCLFVGLNNILGIRPILKYGNKKLKKELLPILATGRELAAFALTEKGAGSNPQGIVSQAVASGKNSWNIQGEKIWSGSAAWAGVTNVFVQERDLNGNYKGISAFAVRRGTSGLRQGKEALTMGMRGMVQNTIYFDDVPVTSQQLLGKSGKGMEVAQDAMMYGRLAIASSCLGGMKRCAQLMLRYTSSRQVSTGRLLDNPVILTRLSGLTAQITAVECLVTQMALLLERDVTIPVELYTACKTSAPEFYWQAADNLVQFLGGRGYIETNIAPQILRDARVLRIFEGPTETLKMFLGSRIVNHNKFLENEDYLAPSRKDAKKDAESNVVNWDETFYKDRDFVAFIQDTFSSADVYEQLLEAVEKIDTRFKDNPIFSKFIDKKRWMYIIVGEIATYAILLAATKYSYQQNPSKEIKKAISWTELQFKQEIDKALTVTPNELVTETTDETSELINSYQQTIGNVQQNLAGEDREIDELLRRGEADKHLEKPLAIASWEWHSPSDCSPEEKETIYPKVDRSLPSPLILEKENSSPPKSGNLRGDNSSIQDWLLQWLSNKLQIPLSKIDRTKAFADYGIDSVMAVELARDLEEWLPNNLEIEPTLAWNFPSIEALAGYLAGVHPRGEAQEREGAGTSLQGCVEADGICPPINEDIDTLSEDELAKSLLEEIALAKEGYN